MKRRILTAAVIAIAALFTFSACSKDEESTAVLAEKSAYSATIKGFIDANLIEQNDTNTTVSSTLEPASGVTVLFYVDAADYLAGSTTSEVKTYSATTGSDGKYSITIPVPSSGTTVTIQTVDFEAMVDQYSYVGPDWKKGNTDRVTFIGTTAIVNVMPNEVKIQDFTY